MPSTTVPPRIRTANTYRDVLAGEPVGDFNFVYRAVKEWRVLPGDDGGAAWHVVASVDADLDGLYGDPTDIQGILRLRMSDGTFSTPAAIDGPVARLIVGYAPIPDFPTSTTVTLEAKRSFGNNAESLAIGRADLIVVSSPGAGEIGGPSYPAGYDVPSPTLTWIMFSPPVGATWTEFNFETDTLTLVGAPTVTASAVDLTAGQRITRPALPEPNDTFDVELDVTTPAATTTGHRFFTTKVGTSNAAPGVSLRFSDTFGSLILRYTDSTGANTVSAAVAGTLSTRQTLRVRKTPTDIEVLRDGVVIISEPRATPLASAPGGEFTINGFQNGTFDGDITVHGVTVLDGA